MRTRVKPTVNDVVIIYEDKNNVNPSVNDVIIYEDKGKPISK